MLIVGTGAVATLLAERLDRAGFDFQVFAEPSPRLEALQTRLPGARGVIHACDIERRGLWLVALKTWQNRTKIEALKHAPPPRAILVLQNGLSPESEWGELGPVERALSTYGVRSVSPGRIAGGESGEIVLPEGSVFQERLSRAGFQVRTTVRMEQAVWQKLAVNASLNVVATLFNLTNGQVLERIQARSLACLAALEVQRVATEAGVDWGERSAWDLTRNVALSTADNVCSTLADIRSGRPTEYDSINLRVLERARALRVSVPTLEALDQKFRRSGVTILTAERHLPTVHACLPLIGTTDDSTGHHKREARAL